MAIASAKIVHDITVRTQSAVVMLVVLSFFVILGGWVFAMGMFALSSIAAFEWARLSRGHHVGFALVIILSIGTVCMLHLLGYPGLVLPSIGGWMLVQLMVRSEHQNERMPQLLFGNLIIGVATWSALSLSDMPPQPLLLIWLLSVVVASDIGAYMSGRMIGGRRLAPLISPGKTWSGLVGAMLSAGVVGFLFSSFFGGNPLLGFATGGLMGMLGQSGDLMISVLKRRAKVKDTGFLIPGHGGILDRTDSLLITLPVFVIVCALLRIPPL